MANFVVSVKNPNTNDIDVSANTHTITLVDWSNYDTNTESAHDIDFFSGSYYKVIFKNPNNTTYTFSSMGDGDAVLPNIYNSDLPISIGYNYSSGDGVYEACVISVPNYYFYTGVGYIDTAPVRSKGQCVVFEGKLYKCLKDGYTENPNNSPNNWQQITEDELPDRYRFCFKFAVTCGIEECFIKKIHKAFCSVEGMNCNYDICNNKEYQTAMELYMAIAYVPILVNRNDWEAVRNLINYATLLCCCNE